MDLDWGKYDQEGAMRQRYVEIDDQTEELKNFIESSEWGWSDFIATYDISWIYHENGLEGIVLSYPEIKSAIDERIVSDVSLLPTYEHIRAQKFCIDLMREKARSKRFQVTIPFLKQLHAKVLNNHDVSGTYRKDIPIHRTYFHDIAQPDDIPARLETVLKHLRCKNDHLHPLEFAASVHHRFMAVFPFSKFSGTLGRLILNYQLALYGYLPAIIHATDRQNYYEALRGSERDFSHFLVSTMESSLENSMRFFRSEGARRGAV